MKHFRALCVAVMAALISPPAVAQTTVPDVTTLRADLAPNVPPVLKSIAVLSEDRAFFERFPTGSTISLAVVSARFLSGPRTLERRLVEQRLVVDLANAFSHDEILALWLQGLAFGRGCTGIEDAMTHLMGKPLAQGDAVDFLTLMTLQNAPAFYTDTPNALLAAAQLLVARGESAGVWSQPEANRLRTALNRPIAADDACPSDE